jgi:hypothetical protein
MITLMVYHGHEVLGCLLHPNWRVVQATLTAACKRRYGEAFRQIQRLEVFQARFTARLVRGWMLPLNSFKGMPALPSLLHVQYSLLDWKEGRATARRLTVYRASLPVHFVLRRMLAAVAEDADGARLYPAIHQATLGNKHRQKQLAYFIIRLTQCNIAHLPIPLIGSWPKFLKRFCS